MGLFDFFRSLFRRKPKQLRGVGWAFVIQANTDLTRRVVYVHVADIAKAEAIALEAFNGLVSNPQPVPESMFADLGVAPGGHKVQTGNGWSFSIEGPPEGPHPLVFVYLSDEAEAEAALRKVNTGVIRTRSEVPQVVLVQDLAMRPGSIRTI
jgi:hypothetical protein